LMTCETYFYNCKKISASEAHSSYIQVGFLYIRIAN
jgi:hypothetical protein